MSILPPLPNASIYAFAYSMDRAYEIEIIRKVFGIESINETLDGASNHYAKELPMTQDYPSKRTPLFRVGDKVRVMQTTLSIEAGISSFVGEIKQLRHGNTLATVFCLNGRIVDIPTSQLDYYHAQKDSRPQSDLPNQSTYPDNLPPGVS